MPEPQITFRRTRAGFVAQDAPSVVPPQASVAEASEVFECFGTTCTVHVIGDTPARTGAESAMLARTVLLQWHDRFSRFMPGSELSRLNADPRETVPVSSTMAGFVEAALGAARLTDGLVDPTLAREIELAGYVGDLPQEAQEALGLAEALALAPPRTPGLPNPHAAWRLVRLDSSGAAVTRPPGVALDSGGIAKGLFADVVADVLSGHESVAVNCGGDLRLSGRARLARPVEVASPFGDELLHVYELADGGVATSGIGKRSWIDAQGHPAHHLLDPASGRPAFTGVVQVTALAPTAVEAEARTKAALLSGPDGASAWLPYGGVVVLDDGSHAVVAPRRPSSPA